MEWWLILIIAFGSLLIFFCSGMPIAISFLALDIIGLYFLFGEKGMTLLINGMVDSLASFTLSPLPLFVLLGEIFYRSKLVDIAFDAIDKWVGSFRARLHIVTLIFSTIFGAISGSGLAITAMLGNTILPQMVKRGYDRKLSMGVIMGGGTIDPLIPPSNFTVLIGSLANVSIAKLLIAGVGPGILYLILFIIYVIIIVFIKPELAPPYITSSTLKEKVYSFINFLPFAIIIFLILGLMMMGITTPTESAAIGAIAAIALGICLRRLTFQLLKDSLWGTAKVSAMVFLIIAGSTAFSQILALSGASRGIVNILIGSQFSPLTILFLMQLIPFILGCFIDQISIMMITIPIYLPLIKTMGFDPIWFWTLFLINMTLGGITPPFGMRLFTLKVTAPETPLKEIYWASIPFIFIIFIGMVIVTIFPKIIVWIPNLFLK
jgi:tripartite ATP-independent transporter DctM subunit